MSCIYKYKGKDYTKEQFYSLVSNSNFIQQEQAKKFTELQERLSNKEFLEGAKNAYESSKDLQQFGTQEEYNDYIARVSLGIIKNPSSGEYNYESQVKDIVYRGGEKEDIKLFQYWTNNKAEAYMYAKANITKGGKITERNPISVIVNNFKSYINNKYGEKTFESLNIDKSDYLNQISEIEYELQLPSWYKKDLQIDNSDKLDFNAISTLRTTYDSIKIEDEGDLDKPYTVDNYDSLKRDYDKARKQLDKYFNIEELGQIKTALLNIKNPYKEEIVQEDLQNDRDAYKNGHDGAFLMDGDHFLVKSNAEQIHILGSKQDIEGFKKFVGQPINKEIKPNEVKGIEINSYQTGLGNSLTNVHYAKNGKSAFDIIPSDKSLKLTQAAKAKWGESVEAWYKSNNAQTKGIAEGVEGDKYDMNLMVGLITDKLTQYPNLIEQINQNGGLAFLQKSTHNMGSGRWSSKNAKNMFMNSLIQAYKNVNQPTEIKPKIDSSKKIEVSKVNYTKNTPNDKSKGFFFTENLQAYLANRGRGAEERFDLASKDVKLDVTATNNQAGIRRNNGIRNLNAFAIISKKYQQNGSGSFVKEEGQFKDTDEDFELFKKYNTEAIDEAIAYNKPLVIAEAGIATGKSALPLRFAEWLNNELKTKLGIQGTIKENTSTGYKGYGIFNLTQEQPIVEETKEELPGLDNLPDPQCK